MGNRNRSSAIHCLFREGPDRRPGIKAAIRAIDLLLTEGMKVRVVLFPDDDDPDSYAKKYGSEAIQNFVNDNATDFVRFKTGILLKDAGNDPLRLSEVAREMVSTIALVGDMMERSEFIRECASIMKVSEKDLTQGVAKAILRNKEKDFKESQRAEQENTTPEQQESQPAPDDVNAPSATDILTSTPEKHQFLPSFFPCEEQEKKIISLLMNHGDQTITMPSKDDDGNEIFENPLYQRIFNEFAEQLQQGNLLSSQYFVNHQEEIVRTLAASLLSQPYTISDEWYKKYLISVPMPDDKAVIANDYHDSMLNLKMKKLEQKITEAKEQLKNTNDPEDMAILLGQINQYEKIKLAIGKELNRVIS